MACENRLECILLLSIEAQVRKVEFRKKESYKIAYYLKKKSQDIIEDFFYA